MWNVLLDALLDSLKVFPFLILLYVLIEIMEEKVSTSKQFLKYTNGKYATLMGAGLGLIPQCGFSVVASDLYSKKYIKMGTMLAIFIATSDEAVPIILSNPTKAYLIFPLLGVKFVYAILVGYVVDWIYGVICRRRTVVEIVPPETEVADENISGCCGHHVEEHRDTFKKLFLHPLIHSLKIFLYIFVVNLALGSLIYYIGEDRVVAFMQNVTYLQPLLVPLVGLIPNCASSVLITQMLILKGITFGSAVAGLCCNAGIGLAVLFKENKNVKQNILVISILYLSSVLLGYIVTLIEMAI